MSNLSIDRIIATELKNGKYRFEAVETDGSAHLIRKAGNLTKGVLQVETPYNADKIKEQFKYNIAEENMYRDYGYAVKVFTPGNGIDVVPYEAQ